MRFPPYTKPLFDGPKKKVCQLRAEKGTGLPGGQSHHTGQALCARCTAHASGSRPTLPPSRRPCRRPGPGPGRRCDARLGQPLQLLQPDGHRARGLGTDAAAGRRPGRGRGDRGVQRQRVQPRRGGTRRRVLRPGRRRHLLGRYGRGADATQAVRAVRRHTVCAEPTPSAATSSVSAPRSSRTAPPSSSRSSAPVLPAPRAPRRSPSSWVPSRPRHQSRFARRQAAFFFYWGLGPVRRTGRRGQGIE